MSEPPPKAHRRLVPRVPKKDPEPDLDVTAPRVVIALEPDESMEMTAIRAPVRPRIDRRSVDPPAIDPDESLDITAQRPSAPPSPNAVDDDEYDAGETLAIPARVDTEPPGPPPDLRPISKRLPIPSYPVAAEGSVPRFAPQQATLAAASHAFVQPAPKVSLPDVDAFADLEPTTLKAHTSSDAEDRPTTHISPAERGLLAAMSEGHEASRMVYVNWLERRGEKTRAEFLRLDHTLAAMNPLDIRYQETQDRLRELAQKISVDWRSRVARSLIEGCRSPGGCPGYWRALPADADDVRQCGTCGQQVFYCVTIELARGRVQAGQPVALDVTVERVPDDLVAPRCGSCGNQLPRDTRFCPHCGRSTMY
jgi:uncharacterized protein (TIGR02996 family)